MSKIIELKDLHCSLKNMTYKVSGFVSAYRNEYGKIVIEAVNLDVVILDNISISYKGTISQMYKLNDVQKANFENRLNQYPQFHQFIEKQL